MEGFKSVAWHDLRGSIWDPIGSNWQEYGEQDQS